MARGRQTRFVPGGQVIASEINAADNTATLAVQAEHQVGTVTIASGQSLSPQVDTGGRRLAAIKVPAAWTAAALTFQASVDAGVTWGDLYDDSGNEVSLAITAGRMIALDALAMVLSPFRYLKLRSGTSASPVAQGADRAIGYSVRGL